MRNKPWSYVITAGRATPGAITATGARIGDLILSFNFTDGLSTPANTFEGTVSVDDQIQQASATNFSAKTFVFTLLPQGWKSIQA